MKILVTGAAGFIGYHTVKLLLKKGHEVVGIDNMTPYYDLNLKNGRLADCGIQLTDSSSNEEIISTTDPNYRFIRMDINDPSLSALFEKEKFEKVCHLAAQPGVRYSITNPESYIQSNLIGFFNILEACRHYPVKKLVFASSSSVYGLNEKIPYSESDFTDQPVSLYAATKKSNELMGYAYTSLFKIPAVGLRFFTVYGPWGRPDMAPMKFMKNIVEGNPIDLYNYGNMKRDFTYIDDIVEGVCRILLDEREVNFEVYNIGNSEPVTVPYFIDVIENATGKKAIRNLIEMQAGDVYCTYADTDKILKDYGYAPYTSLEEGIGKLYAWYKEYYS